MAFDSPQDGYAPDEPEPVPPNPPRGTDDDDDELRGGDDPPKERYPFPPHSHNILWERVDEDEPAGGGGGTRFPSASYTHGRP